ncbi:hypothetical protein CH063_04165, partial [Colletotrichum higginsianum]
RSAPCLHDRPARAGDVIYTIVAGTVKEPSAPGKFSLGSGAQIWLRRQEERQPNVSGGAS